MVALRGLNSTTSQLGEVRQRISSGERVSSVRDNGAVWSIAQSQRSDIAALDVIIGSLQRVRSATDVAMAAGETVAQLLTEMKTKALAASDASLNATAREALNADFKVLRDRIASTVAAAEFNGVNLIKTGAQNAVALAGLAKVSWAVAGNGNAGGNGNGNAGGNGNGNAGGNGNGNAGGNNTTIKTGFTTITVKTEVLSLGGPNVTVTAQAGFTSAAQAAAMATMVDASLKNVSGAMTRLGTSAASLDTQTRFVAKTQAALEASVGYLVDADLARESARLEALQLREKLGIEALSIASAQPGKLLQLFRD